MASVIVLNLKDSNTEQQELTLPSYGEGKTYESCSCIQKEETSAENLLAPS